jgi:crotonobetainyl-CoA:carnitine CoA-transferase CaiB-like acyl-CoA transferase
MFENLSILEIGEGIAVPYCGKLMSGFGAEVIKIEGPQGDVSRRMGPFKGGSNSSKESGLFIALNNGKKSVCLDLDSKEGEKHFKTLLKKVDVVIEDNVFNNCFEENYCYEALSLINSDLIYLSVSDFSHSGTRSTWKSTDLTLFHMSGNAHGVLGPVDNPHDNPPVRAGGYQSEFLSGMTVCTALMMAIYRKNMTGLGGYVEVSKYEALVTQTIAGLANMAFEKDVPERDLSKVKEASVGGMVGAVGGVLPTNDGYVAISPREDDQWQRWVKLMGSPDWANEDRFRSRSARQTNFEDLWSLISDWTRNYSKHDIAARGQENHIPCFPVNTVDDLFEDEQFEHRGFFVDSKHPDFGKLRLPGVPYNISNMELHLINSSAPSLGEHNSVLLRNY